MTRQEFLDDVNSFYELIDFCQNERLDICDDIYDADTANEIIMERLGDYRNWQDAYRFLDDIPVDCEYYHEDGYGDFEDADDMFEDYKDDVLSAMDDGDYWDEEEEDYDDEVWEPEDSDCDDDEEIEIADDALFAVLGKAG